METDSELIIEQDKMSEAENIIEEPSPEAPALPADGEARVVSVLYMCLQISFFL